MIQRPIQRFSNSADGEVKAAAIAAGQSYQDQEDVILQGALDAAQRIGSSALFEMLQIMRPIPGAASKSGAGLANPPERDKSLGLFNDIAGSLQQKYHIDFLILADTDGKILAPYGMPGSVDEMVKTSPLVTALLKDAPAYTPRVASMDRPRPALDPLIKDKGIIEQQGGPLKVVNGLVIEAVAPVLRVGGGLLGVVVAGQLINDSRSIVDKVQTQLSAVRNRRMDVSVIFKGVTVATTMTNVTKGHGIAVGEGIAKSTAPSVHPTDWGNGHVLAAVYPIRNASNMVIAQIAVTEPQDVWRDTMTLIGPSVIAMGIAFIITILAVFILSSSLSRALRRLNTDIIRVGLGDFEEEIEPLRRHDEAGDLSESLERLRITVKQAIERLRRRGVE